MAIVWLGHSTFKRKSGRRKPDDHVDEHAHEWLQALFIDRLGDDVERHGFFALHQVPDTEVGSGHVSGNHRVAVDRQIREGSREHTAGFFLGSVKLVARCACDQRMRFAAVVEITEHIAPHIVSFLLWIAKQPVNGREGCWSVLPARAIQHMSNCTRQ